MIKETPLISVIVPVYCVEQYIDRCMDSIVTQTYQNLELILVDDGSPDNCPALCDAWQRKDNRIKVIHKVNGGLSSARNAGLDAAAGDFITFVDSDDWLEPDAIEYLLDILMQFDADFSMAENTREKNVPNALACCLTQKDFLKKFFKVGNQANVQYAWAKLYKRQLFANIRYPLGLTAEDVPTTFSIAMRANKIAYSGKIVYNYYVNAAGITGGNFTEKRFDMLRVWDLICNEAIEGRYAADIIEMAQMNRKRVDFGLLADLALSKNYRQCYAQYQTKIDAVRNDLNINLSYLLKQNIPLSRKLAMIGFVYFFWPTVWCVNQCGSRFK